MLVIRPEQMRIFESAAYRQFEADMLAHLMRRFPPYASMVGAPVLRRVVREGHDKAQRYGFHTQREVCLYTELAIMLGHQFDSDPQLPWARELLTTPNIRQAANRINRVYDAAMEYLDAVVGPNSVFPLMPLRMLRDRVLPELEQQVSRGGEAALREQLRRVWPQKFERIGAEALDELLVEGRAQARTYGFQTPSAVAFYTLLMYTLGAGFGTDPQYGWASEVLQSNEKNVQRKAVQLRDAFENALEAALVSAASA